MGYRKNNQNDLTDAQQKVLNAVKSLKGGTPKEILNKGLGRTISKQMLHRHLNTLVAKGYIQKLGKVPLVFYEAVSKQEGSVANKQLDWTAIIQSQVINTNRTADLKNFAYLDHTGLLRGPAAFSKWFENKYLPSLIKNQSKKKSIKEQIISQIEDLREKYTQTERQLTNQRDKSFHLFDSTERYNSIHSIPAIDHVFYFDFYSIPVFGKTYTGYLIQKAKVGDSGCVPYIEEVAHIIQKPLTHLITFKKFDALVWTPHTIQRKYPFLGLLRDFLDIGLPEISVKKSFSKDATPQKALPRLDQRLENARSSNHIVNSRSLITRCKKILIIDDAIGSGATIHSIAEKLKNINNRLDITAFAPVGSYKGFEVIQDI